MSPATAEVTVDGRRLRLSNLDKIFYPATGFTKGEVIDYYARVAPAVLPHLRDRPITLKRYPDGAAAPHFYEKQCPSHRPDWVSTAAILSRGEGRFGRESKGPREIEFCLVNDLPTLVWSANLANLELHTPLARAGDTTCPTMVAFDLDPGEPAGLVECARVALLVRELFERLGLRCFAKTSGSKGMQVYLPLNTPTTYDDTTPFASAVAQLLEHEHRDLVVAQMKKELRRGKVFVDWSQNVDFKTTVCVYSLRAMERPIVSTPLAWDEVQQACDAADAGRLVFDSYEVLGRVEERGDLFAPVLELEQELPKL